MTSALIEIQREYGHTGVGEWRGTVSLANPPTPPWTSFSASTKLASRTFQTFDISTKKVSTVLLAIYFNLHIHILCVFYGDTRWAN